MCPPAGVPSGGRITTRPSLAGAWPLAALAALLLLGCGGEEGPAPVGEGEAADRIGVVASVPPLGWLVEAVGGDLVEVTVLVPPGASPAMYEPTLRQLRRLDRARLWVTVGHPRFPFEAAWLERLTSGRPDLEVVGAGSDCRRRADDPHVWLSPACVLTMVERITDALARERPAAADSLRARGRRAADTVEAVDRDLRALLAPHRGGAFLVFHPALGYLSREYGLEQMAIQRGAMEPNPAELDRLVRRAREKGVRDVFVQPQFSREAATLVAGALEEGRVVIVDPLARDWPRSLRTIGRQLAEPLASRSARTAP